MMTSTTNLRPVRPACSLCPRNSRIACLTRSAVCPRTPPRVLSTRSTVASLRPAWSAISLMRNGWPTGDGFDGFLMGRRNNLAGLSPYTELQKRLHGGKLMKDDNAKRLRANRVWLTADSCDLEEFKGQVEG